MVGYCSVDTQCRLSFARHKSFQNRAGPRKLECGPYKQQKAHFQKKSSKNRLCGISYASPLVTHVKNGSLFQLRHPKIAEYAAMTSRVNRATKKMRRVTEQVDGNEEKYCLCNYYPYYVGLFRK